MPDPLPPPNNPPSATHDLPPGWARPASAAALLAWTALAALCIPTALLPHHTLPPPPAGGGNAFIGLHFPNRVTEGAALLLQFPEDIRRHAGLMRYAGGVARRVRGSGFPPLRVWDPPFSIGHGGRTAAIYTSGGAAVPLLRTAAASNATSPPYPHPVGAQAVVCQALTPHDPPQFRRSGITTAALAVMAVATALSLAALRITTGSWVSLLPASAGSASAIPIAFAASEALSAPPLLDVCTPLLCATLPAATTLRASTSLLLRVSGASIPPPQPHLPWSALRHALRETCLASLILPIAFAVPAALIPAGGFWRACITLAVSASAAEAGALIAFFAASLWINREAFSDGGGGICRGGDGGDVGEGGGGAAAAAAAHPLSASGSSGSCTDVAGGAGGGVVVEEEEVVVVECAPPPPRQNNPWLRTACCVARHPCAAAAVVLLLGAPLAVQAPFLTLSTSRRLQAAPTPGWSGVDSLESAGLLAGSLSPCYVALELPYAPPLPPAAGRLGVVCGAACSPPALLLLRAAGDAAVAAAAPLAGGVGYGMLVSVAHYNGSVVTPADVPRLLRWQPGYRAVRQQYVGGQGRVALMEVRLPFESGSSGRGAVWYRGMRERLQALNAKAAVGVGVGGAYRFHLASPVAGDVEVADSVVASTPAALSLVMVCVMVFVGVVFRSAVLPFRLAFALLYTVLVTLGIAVVAFQTKALWWAIPDLELFENDGLAFTVPAVVLPVCIALGLDYDIFLLTRVEELRMQGYSDVEAVILGVARTGPTISGAAVIMVIAFSGLLFAPEMTLKQFGLILSVSVLLDAFVIRTILVPALMVSAAQRNWWPRNMPDITKALFTDPAERALYDLPPLGTAPLHSLDTGAGNSDTLFLLDDDTEMHTMQTMQSPSQVEDISFAQAVTEGAAEGDGSSEGSCNSALDAANVTDIYAEESLCI